MARIARSCTQSLLKLINSIIGMVGIAMILYALWMFRAWNKNVGPHPLTPFPTPDVSVPWFIYSFLGLGITLCVIACSGHIAAETANGCCLYFYMVFVFLLLMLEAAVTVDVFLNRNWEEDFPEDVTGNFDKLKDFVRENFEMCKWIMLSVVSIQGLCMLLAMILKALGPLSVRYDDSDDDEYTTPDRAPLLRNYAHPQPYVVGDPVYASHTDSWNVRINSKANK